MNSTAEVIEAPLSPAALGERFREICADPRFANLPGKVELDVWGRMLLTPADNCRGLAKAWLACRLAIPGGEPIVNASVSTAVGLLVADVAWASVEFLGIRGTETPFTSAPELCVEVVSPSNSRKELRDKVAAYLAAGAEEVWLVYPQSARVEVHGKDGILPRSRFAVDLSGLFD